MARIACELLKRTPLAMGDTAVSVPTPVNVKLLPFPVRSGQVLEVALLAS